MLHTVVRGGGVARTHTSRNINANMIIQGAPETPHGF
jgi:hypothetical protein